MSGYLKGLADKINGVEKQGFTQELDINLLVPSKNNFYGIREIEELAESIRENGLMHNLVARKKDDGTYEILSGERRFHAAKSLGYKTLPCQVKEISDLDAEIMLIQANSAQRELTPTEKMEGIKRLERIYKQKRDNGEKLQGKTRDLIGKDLGLSGVQVGRYKKVDKDLIPDLKEKLDKEEITLTQAHTLSSLSHSEQKVIHDEIKNLDSKECKEEIETLVNGIKQPVENKLDKELLDEMYSDKSKDIKSKSSTNVLDKLKEALDRFAPQPKFVISDEVIKGIFQTSEVKLNESILKVQLAGFGRVSFMNIKPVMFKKVEEIEVEDGKKVTPKHGYKISESVYIWFNEKYQKADLFKNK